MWKVVKMKMAFGEERKGSTYKFSLLSLWDNNKGFYKNDMTDIFEPIKNFRGHDLLLLARYENVS